jgi:hypothetical protein
MNPITRIAIYEKISTIIKYKYKGDMYRIKGRLTDLLITPDHTFFGSSTQAYPTKHSKSVIRFKTIKEITQYKNFTIPITSNYKGKYVQNFILPEVITTWETKCEKKGSFSSSRKYKKKIIAMDAWVAFLGIWLADGYVAKNANGKIGTIGICASKGRKKEYFQPILDNTPWKWKYHNTGWKIDNRQLALYLKNLGGVYTKYIPREFINLHSSQIQILFDSMMAGDGCISTNKQKCFSGDQIYTSKTYYSSSKPLINNFQELAIKLGHATSIFIHKPKKWHIRKKTGWSKESYSVHILKSNNVNLCTKEINIVNYNDYVFDVETKPNHTIFIRRNNNSVWSSNCTTDNVKGLPIPQSEKAIKKMLPLIK